MDAVTERFLALWGTPERGRRLWDEWHAAFGESASVLDTMAEVEAETVGIPLEQAQEKMALEKFVEDRGSEYIAKWLHQHDAEQLRQSRSLKPMAANSAARKKKA